MISCATKEAQKEGPMLKGREFTEYFGNFLQCVPTQHLMLPKTTQSFGRQGYLLLTPRLPFPAFPVNFTTVTCLRPCL